MNEAELAMFGLLPSDLDDDGAVEMWPDTAEAICLFVAMDTQWRSGYAGPTGLDYAALPTVMRLRGIPRSRQSDAFEDLRLMEVETLKLINRDRP